ncbi:xanthine dehydrogenase family protein molybdopterin-binding subunit [Roseococcus microcysteis]|uniref:xanthine dehydrogenase family protein molybdopterin-binding subunit n=1 Tax=Roseococcus microcysteis TaxID=2771361 RepID=UPI001E5AAF02|nr:molybdopterin cofactor-binding domain-containing protein [Roseococcus microcysteis]
MPYTNVTKKIFDSGDYPEALRRAAEAMDREGFASRQRAAREQGRLLGQGFAIFCEQGAHGTSVYHGWGIPFVPGAEPCQARLTPDGGLELRVGVHSHGQGMETTLAQVAHEILGVPVERVQLIHGDTALTPYSTGTWGSRCAVMAGGAVAEACTELRERLLPIGRHLLQAPDAVFEDGAVRAGNASVSVAEMARIFHRAPQNLTEAMQARGLECTAGHKTVRDTGTFSYAAHAVEVEVDPGTGHVTLHRYVIVEDGGVLLNPLVADGQVLGGTVQGIGTALFEEMPYDAAGQPLASTFADYMLPGASDVPDIEILHMETPSPISRFGQKGIGESGAIGPPAAIVNAINDAIAHLGCEVTDIPATPERVLAALS